MVVQNSLNDQQVRFEEIMDFYSDNPDKLASDKLADKVIDDLRKLHDSSSVGFANRMSLYAIGNLYYDKKNYKEAKKYLLEFSGLASSDMFAAIALQKAALSAEALKDIDGAIKIYRDLEKGFSGSVIEDQFVYNMARTYRIKGNQVFSKRYYLMLISNFPQSAYAQRAKKELLLSGMKK